MPLSRQSLGIYQETSSYATRQGTIGQSRLSSLSHCGLMLPHWCVYIAWLLVATMSGVSTFITFSYSMEWGREKSIAWLSAMFLSVGQSIMLVQPFKVS